MAFDWEDIFSFETLKIIRVIDLRLGILYRCLQLLIAIYILYEIIRNQRYLKMEPPVPAAIRISLKAPNSITTPYYCNGTMPCAFWDASDIQYPSDGTNFAFFTTRASILHYPNQPGCNTLRVSSPADHCFFKPTNNNVTILPNSYIADIEDYTVMIEHSIRGEATSIAIRNGVMDGELVSYNGTTIRKITNATRMASNPYAAGDIFTVQEILTAAGANLDAPSTANSANKTAGETYRSSGIVIAIIIEYKNVALKTNTITYRYLPRAINGNKYKAVENIYNTTDGSTTLINRNGIRLVFQQHGTIGEFQFIALLTSLIASLALLNVSVFLVEMIMLYLLPQRDSYQKVKYLPIGPPEKLPHHHDHHHHDR
ncbi:P2X purinoceptor 4 [Gigaspora margarita]|uniref:P2X purinoceptor 4 n=1 Tax=Gigaspora margarita TaxID=4874 RepID=A0A8H4EKC3_GIGMA|nr:P2X purinoceptor 4 [Gigaspora margarita]